MTFTMSSPRQGPGERCRNFGARGAGLISMFDQIDHEPLRWRISGEGDAPKYESPSSEMERARALGIVHEWSRENGCCAKAERVPTIGPCENEWRP